MRVSGLFVHRNVGSGKLHTAWRSDWQATIRKGHFMYRFSLIFISGVSVLLLVAGIVLRIMGREDVIESRSVFILVGTLGMLIGNALWSLTTRVARLEKELAERK